VATITLVVSTTVLSGLARIDEVNVHSFDLSVVLSMPPFPCLPYKLPKPCYTLLALTPRREATL
jgi:hypothetical protein